MKANLQNERKESDALLSCRPTMLLNANTAGFHAVDGFNGRLSVSVMIAVAPWFPVLPQELMVTARMKALLLLLLLWVKRLGE